MTHYLVLANTPMDNVPLALCLTESEALDIGRSATLQSVQEVANRVLGVDVSDVVCTVMVPVRNGVPGEMQIIRDFDEEVQARWCRYCRGDETASACECV